MKPQLKVDEIHILYPKKNFQKKIMYNPVQIGFNYKKIKKGEK